MWTVSFGTFAQNSAVRRYTTRRPRMSFLLVQKDIQRERDERCCGDNAIINYANATFYPKMVADVTTGTETTAQSLYNPLPNCGRCCK